MSGRPEIEVFKRDNAIRDIIFEHKGIENAISTQEIVCELKNKGFSENAATIHTIIKSIIEKRRMPICSVINVGYYYPKRKSDIQAAIDDIAKKRDGLQRRIDFLKEFIIE